MPAGVTQDVDEQLARAVDDLCDAVVRRDAGDVAGHRQDAGHRVESGRPVQGGEGVERAVGCSGVRGRLVDVLAGEADSGEHAIAPGQLTADVRNPVVYDDRVDRLVRRVRGRECEAQLGETVSDHVRQTRAMAEVFTVQAEPLTAAAFAPYGQVVGADECVMELGGGEVFHLNVLSYEHRPIEADHLNRHHKATQMLVSLAGKPWVIFCAASSVAFTSRDDLAQVRAFIADGSAGVNLALGTWHEGPYALTDRVDLVNVQGAHVEDDNEVAYLEKDLGVVLRATL